MYRIATLILSAIIFTSSYAQTIEGENGISTYEAENVNMPITEGVSPATIEDATLEREVALDSARNTIAYIPRFAMQRPSLFTFWAPTSPFGWGTTWDVHEGFNAQIGMGVIVGFGKNNPFKGASFYTDLSLIYAKPVSEHWTLALGGTLSRFKFFNDNVFTGSVFALGNYRFNEHWSASVYASYNHMPECARMYDFTTFNENCARIGGEVTYRFNEKFSMSLGLSHEIPIGDPNNRPWKPQRPLNADKGQINR